MNPSKRLPRRTFLRGVGSAIALPFFDAMVPGPARNHAMSPCRMALLYVPNGIIMEEWTPATEPRVAALPAELPRVLQTLGPYKNQITILSGLTHNTGLALGDGPGRPRARRRQLSYRRAS